MIDFDITSLFIYKNFCKERNILTQSLKCEISLYNINKSKNLTEFNIHATKLRLSVDSTESYETFLVFNVDSENIILRLS